MTSKPTKDDAVLLLHSVAIVLKEKRGKRRSRSGENHATSAGGQDGAVRGVSRGSPAPTGTPSKAGLVLFEDFVNENRLCHWNPHLEESIKSLKYAGCLHPSTLLVTGREIFLDTIKSAWSRRALRPPPQYSINSVGDVHGIMMEAIPQAHFTPLPEALCQIISDITRSACEDVDLLKRLNAGASLDAILDRLQESYRAMQQPSEHIVYETLGNLMKERKIFHTGSGYGIVSPESFRLNGCITVQDNHLVIGGGPGGSGDTLVIPLPPHAITSSPTPPPPMQVVSGGVSISCQTDDNATSMQRSMSVKEEGSEAPPVEIGRSQSMREDVQLKDINLKTSDAHLEKDKGEKSSLLNKLFGRNKSKRSNSMGRTSIDNGAAEERGKDYATFSAQFPPPEWLWYEEHARPKPTTWGQHSVLLGDAASESNSEAGGECPLHTLPQGIPGFMDLAEGNTYTEDPCGFFENKDLHTSMHSHESGGGPALEVEAAGQSKELVVPRKVRNRSPRKTRHKRRSKVKKMSDEEEEEEEVEEDGEHDEEAVLNNAKVMSRVDRPPTHVSRVFRKYREMKGHSFLSNDIHIEFKGQLDKKSFGKSKESGVNCVGVDALDPPPPPTANHVEHAVEVHRSENLHEDSGFNSPRTTNENLYESIASRTAECFSDSSKQTVVHEAPLRNSLSPKQVRRKKNDRLLNCVQGSNRLSKHVDKQAVQQQVSDTVSAEKKKELKVVGML